MRLYYYKDDNQKMLRKIDRDNIVDDICKKAKAWHEDTLEVRNDYNRINREIFPSTVADRRNVKLIPDVYEQYQTYKANIFKSTYQNYDGMFDIEGEDPESHSISAILKASLVYDFYKVKLKNSLDAILEDWVTKGECAAFIHWDTEVERTREQKADTVINPETGIEEIEITNIPVNKITHSGPDIKRIDPLNLYFDKTQRYNWSMCGKIYRDFAPIQYILANTKYRFTKEERAELKQLVAEQSKDCTTDLTADKLDIDTHIIGSSVEVLEYYGDYIIPDKGDIVRNVVMTVIAGKYLVQVEESQYPMCPIVYSTYLDRPDTLRGQSPLKPTLLLNELENRCMDLQMAAWKLTVNPPVLAPKGMIAVGQKVEPGRPFEYTYDAFDPGVRPIPMDFSAGMRGFDFQDFFKRKMEGATGISPYMQGTGGTGGVRTASESTYIYSGQTTRIAREAYLFSEKVILPIVCGFFKMKREFETGLKFVPVKREGTVEFQQVDDQVRNGNYTFMIGNAQTAVEREQYVQRIIEVLGTPAFASITQRPEFPSMDFFKWVLNEVNFRQITSLTQALTMGQAIANQGREMGVPQGDMGKFTNTMNNMQLAAIPEFANILAEQQAEGDIPDVGQTRDEVVAQDNSLI